MKSSASVLRLVLPIATVVVVSLSGCGHTAAPQDAETTTAVTGVDQGLEAYNRLKNIEERRPDLIPASARTDYPWAFDPVTGHLVPYRDAYARGYELNCRGVCIQVTYTEILAAIDAAIGNGK